MSWYGSRRFLRAGKSSAFLVVTLAIATAVFVGPVIASDTGLAGGLTQVLEATPAHLTLSTTNERFLNASEYWRLAEAVTSVDGVARAEIIAHRNTYESSFTAVNYDSAIRAQMVVETGPSWLGPNETYIVTGSPSVTRYRPGTTVLMEITYRNNTSDYIAYPVNLTIVGQVTLLPALRRIALMDYSIKLFPQEDIYGHQVDLFLLNWNATMAPLIDYFVPRVPYFSIGTNILISVNLESVVNPYDLGGTEARLSVVEAEINSVAEGSRMSLENWISGGLTELAEDVSVFTGQIVLSVLPSMFLALYICKLLGDVSADLRRKEVSLLLSRGVPARKVVFSALMEAVPIAAIGGGLGLLLSMASVNLLLNMPQPIVVPRIGPVAVLTAFTFAAVTSVLGLILPIRGGLSTWLKDNSSEVSSSRSGKTRLLVWLLFLMGAYRIVTWWLGFDPRQLAEGVSNLLAIIFYNGWISLHDTLTWFAPILFVYGATRVVTEELPAIGSVATNTAGKLFGDVGAFAARYGRRRLSRMATLILILGLIASYGVWSIGVNASQQEHFVRSAYVEVGSDLRTYLDSTANASYWVSAISGFGGVSRATAEIGLTVMTDAGSALAYAVDPLVWSSVAFYEEYWFRQTTSQAALAEMAMDNLTIVLEQRVASALDIHVGDHVAIEVPSLSRNFTLRVLGFYLRGPLYHVSGAQTTQSSWSLIPLELFEQLNSSVDLRKQVIARLNPGTDGRLLENELANLDPEIRAVKSVAGVAASYSQSLLLRAPRDAAFLTAVFGALLASLGILSVTSIALRERQNELRLLSTRGYSSALLMKTLAVEIVGVLMLALPIGLFVGLGSVLGSVDAFNNPLWLARSGQVVGYQVAFAPWDLLWLSFLLLSMIAAIVVPSAYAALRADRDIERLSEEEWI
jgi:ABC-type lipoprotein release transport system permease subunit